MLDFCRKSGYFSGTRKRHEISMLSEGPSIILGKSYRMLLQQKQADPGRTVLIQVREPEMLMQAELYQGQEKQESTTAKKKKEIFEKVVATVNAGFDWNFPRPVS
jgi:hypothetical protein